MLTSQRTNGHDEGIALCGVFAVSYHFVQRFLLVAMVMLVSIAVFTDAASSRDKIAKYNARCYSYPDNMRDRI